jgi:hypothetical protein
MSMQPNGPDLDARYEKELSDELHALETATIDRLNCDALSRLAADAPEQNPKQHMRSRNSKANVMLTAELGTSMKTFPDIASTCQRTSS